MIEQVQVGGGGAAQLQMAAEASEHAEQAMAAYWNRIQGFVTDQLSSFEQRVTAAGGMGDGGAGAVGGGGGGSGGGRSNVMLAKTAVDAIAASLRLEMEEQERTILGEVDRKLQDALAGANETAAAGTITREDLII